MEACIEALADFRQRSQHPSSPDFWGCRGKGEEK